MKTIGLLGGMSWESTALYYQQLNKIIQQRLGGLHSAKIILNSVNFAEIEYLQQQGDWAQAAQILQHEARKLQDAKVDGILLCTNTMHLVAPEIQQAISVPLLHIADATAKYILKQNIYKVALLGTAFTMEQDFYKDRLMAHGLEILIPSAQARAYIHHTIYNELCVGKIKESSKQAFLNIIEDLKQQGAQGIILGCTEIVMLLPEQNACNLPLFDTTFIHVKEAAKFMLSEASF
ncbi:aspartate/glutamate racemase family protein [Acinetobacter sp. B5B]|uniref:aspartate/glutamate racemase family protein n=1 Tax=Acinetobacter baretiae TaxID=2605383 RepID=UPI0018C209AF|nr:aspartate/glutamate racemase family protein [Acinetobacter baretiae]MBF7682660.1 aspartate/glutamate racemase family protein [Acinetobacter baretiae]